MKKTHLLVLLGMLMSSYQVGRGQVFGHPGATWVFTNTPIGGVCFETWKKYEYVGDTLILGVNAKNIQVTTKSIFGFPPYDSPPYPIFTYNSNKFYHVSGDSVSLFYSADSTWKLQYNFSLQVGDTTQSPLLPSFVGGDGCDSAIYHFPAVVTNVGLDTIAGESLRFYTLKYRINIGPVLDLSDTTYAFQTYYERLITTADWYAYDTYLCGNINEGTPFGLVCYKDDDMITNNSCENPSWYLESISIEENEVFNISIYPNPVQEMLIIKSSLNDSFSFQIFSTDGKLLMNNIQSPINVSNLSSGVYFITNESRSWYKKFIKQ